MHTRISTLQQQRERRLLDLGVPLGLFKFLILADISGRAVAGAKVTITHHGKDSKLDNDLGF